jgi:predicted nucleic acid-binding protein
MTSNNAAFLVDTNILIYSYDGAEPAKRSRATEVLNRLGGTGLGALSLQVLFEFYTNVTRKPSIPLTPEQARDSSIRYALSWPILEPELQTFLDALQAVLDHRLSFWDALIWATAKQARIDTVLTEDQQHGRRIESIRYLDPFDPRFDLAILS